MAKKILNKKWAQLIVHFLAYNATWFACVFSAIKGYAWVGLSVALVITLLQFIWQHTVAHRTRNLLCFLIYLTIIGFVGDSLMSFLGIISFSANPFSLAVSPPYMLGIWINFAMLFYVLLNKLIYQPTILVLLSFVGFAGAYQVGAKMGVATINGGLHSVIGIGLFWAVLFPCSVIFFDRLIGFPEDK
ncbi:MAG: DUF2878 domain-containing protein [Candidatus Berkiella sp.]